MDVATRERIRTITEDALIRSVERDLSGTDGALGVGSILLFGGTDLAIFWVLLSSHPDDVCLYFAVPIDECPLIRSEDLSVSDTGDLGRLTVRCGFGLWLSDTVLARARIVGRLGEKERERALDVVAALIHGTRRIDRELDDDVEAVEWSERVAAATQALEVLRDVAELEAEPIPGVELVFRRGPPTGRERVDDGSSRSEDVDGLAALAVLEQGPCELRIYERPVGDGSVVGLEIRLNPFAPTTLVPDAVLIRNDAGDAVATVVREDGKCLWISEVEIDDFEIVLMFLGIRFRVAVARPER